MEHTKKGNNNLVKVSFVLSDTGWGWKEESMWALHVQSTDIFKLDNIPLLAYGICQGDIFRAKLSENGNFNFEEVVEHRGHSTLRIIFKEKLSEDKIKLLLQTFNDLGCNYEGNGSKLFAIDVPKDADLQSVLEVLKQGEANGVWDYEEGYIYS
jgi:hypothetical protein